MHHFLFYKIYGVVFLISFFFVKFILYSITEKNQFLEYMNMSTILCLNYLTFESMLVLPQ